MAASTSKTRTRRAFSPAAMILCTGLLLLAYVCFFAAHWYVTVYGRVGFDSILFTLRSGLEGTQSGLIASYLQSGLLPALVCTAATAFLLFFRPIQKAVIALGKKRGYVIHFLRKGVSIAAAVVLSLALLICAGCNVELFGYLYDCLNQTELYEKEYVDPDSVQINFPEEKRNLIYIFLESMEISYLSEDLGGAEETNLIPELYALAQENTNFSHNSGVGGFHSPSGTTWTIGAMVSQTAGIPLRTPSGNQNDYGNTTGSSFLPGVSNLTSILKNNGYYTTLMVGSDANFGGRKSYYTTHGADQVYDLYTARKDGIVPGDYFVWWGMEDEHLFDYAKQELTEISQKDQPFAFTMLTVDTHHIGGCLCDKCGSEYEEQYENVISCSSRQVAEFIAWIQAQPFYENTTVIICGDHPSMDNGYFERNIDENYERLIYNCFLNAAVTAGNSKNRDFTSLDLFPTTLAALGCEIEGNRLGFGTNLFSNLPTLAERMGYEELNAELSKASDYYAQHFYGDSAE